MKLNNTWIGYVERTIVQTKAAILAKITNPITGIPEMTDHTDSNPWIKTINIWTGLMELLHFYLDNAAREVFLPVSRQYKSAALIAQLFDYRIRGMIASTVDLTFKLNSTSGTLVSIPSGTEVQTASGVRFFTQGAASIEIGQTEVVISAANLIPVPIAVAGISNGGPDQKMVLIADIADLNIIIIILGVQWTVKETLAYSVPSDLDCVVGMNELGNTQITFGDGKNGYIPTVGASVNYTCKRTVGNAANVLAGSINAIISPITLAGGILISCTNNNSSTGGNIAEGLERLQKNIPLSTRTLFRAVASGEYKAIAELAPGVAKAGEEYDCGRTVKVYISPDGSINGIASGGLIATTQAFVDARKIITTRVQVNSAGIIVVKQNWNVVAKSGYVNGDLQTEIKAALAAFLTVSVQDIFGKVEKGDLYQIVEGIDGVNYSRLDLITTQPYARPVDHTNQLTWTRETQATSGITTRWAITKNNGTNYALLKDGTYIGTYNWGNLVTMDEVVFTIQNNVSAVNGSVWEFYSYKYNDNLLLAEPSIPISDLADITVNVTGGI